MGFDSVVFADTARIAALSCLGRLRIERDAGRKCLLIALRDVTGSEAIEESGFGSVRLFDDVEAELKTGHSDQPWRERFSVLIRRLGPKHVLAPLGLLAAPQAVDYFQTLRSALSVDRGRDLLFFEERPQCLVPESVPLQLAARGVRLPPASQLRSPRRYAPFMIRLTTGFGVPPMFGGLGERSKLARSLKAGFREVADWDPQRALGPKLQPVVENWNETDTDELFSLAARFGEGERLGTRSAFRRRMARHALSAGSALAIERSWLSLPNATDVVDSVSDSY